MAYKKWATGPFFFSINFQEEACGVMGRGTEKRYTLIFWKFYAHWLKIFSDTGVEKSLLFLVPNHWKKRHYALGWFSNQIFVGGEIPSHNDTQPGQHWRWHLLMMMQHANQGGSLILDDEDLTQNPRAFAALGNRFVLFRPDKITHMVMPVEAGKRHTWGFSLYSITLPKPEEAA